MSRLLVALAAAGLWATAGCASSGVADVASRSSGASGAAAERGPLAALPSAGLSAGAEEAPALDENEIEPVAVPIEGTELVRGRATVVVHAPVHAVREAVLAFRDYPDFMPHYRTCKVLGRTATGARDVYMEIAALHGALRMWARVEVPKPVIQDGVETYETQFIEGNVDDFKAIWRLRKLDGDRTELSLEVFLKPKVPMPTQMLNNENLGGSVKGVLAMRARAEQARAR